MVGLDTRPTVNMADGVSRRTALRVRVGTLRAIAPPAPTFVPIQEVSRFVDAHHRDRRVDYVPFIG